MPVEMGRTPHAPRSWRSLPAPLDLKYDVDLMSSIKLRTKASLTYNFYCYICNQNLSPSGEIYNDFKRSSKRLVEFDLKIFDGLQAHK
jgi:hypothetical protein